jgi:ribosomal protein S18 acetylase RimI-like enzyme
MSIQKEIVLEEVTSPRLAELQAISQTTFLQAFGADNDPDDLKAYMEEAFSLAQLKKELENPESLFFFALYKNKVIGYLKVNWGAAQTEYQLDHAMELQRIYVLEDFHGKKIGQLLMDKALAIAKEQKLSNIWLGVWEENKKALHLYEKNGFEVVGTHQFLLGDDLQTDLVMRLDRKD